VWLFAYGLFSQKIVNALKKSPLVQYPETFKTSRFQQVGPEGASLKKQVTFQRLTA
jgi:hypothetical protein